MTKLPSAHCTHIPIQSIRITPSPLQHSPGACSRDRAYRRPPPACSGDWRAGPLRPSVRTRPGPASAARRAGLLRPAVRAGVLTAAWARRRRPAQGIRGGGARLHVLSKTLCSRVGSFSYFAVPVHYMCPHDSQKVGLKCNT